MFKTYYQRRFKEILLSPLQSSDGLGENTVRARLKKRGLTLPRALAEYYSLAGKHSINVDHNRLRPIDQLEWIDDTLVLMEENQCVSFWGIQRKDIKKANPKVWQGVNSEPIRWFVEVYRVSQFLMAMWKWTVTGEEETPE